MKVFHSIQSTKHSEDSTFFERGKLFIHKEMIHKERWSIRIRICTEFQYLREQRIKKEGGIVERLTISIAIVSLTWLENQKNMSGKCEIM